MKKTAKFLSLLLAVVIAMSAFSISGFAVATELEAGNSKETAANIPEYSVKYVSEISTPSEWDWFKFTTVSNPAYYGISFKTYTLPSSSPSPRFYLYDSNLQQLAEVYCGQWTNLKLEVDSVYYIKVQNGTFNGRYDDEDVGTYEIEVWFIEDKDANSSNDATEISVNNTYIKSMDGWGDHDNFKFIAPISAEYTLNVKNYNINTDGYMLEFYLRDKYGQTLGSGKSSKGDKKSFKVNLEKDQEYYIEIYMGSYRWKETGDYEFSVNYDVPVTLTSISLASVPSKTEYIIGDTFDVNGLSVEAEYSDGTKKAVEGYSITGFDSSTSGKKTVTITYTENGVTCTCTFDVTVSEPAPAVELTALILESEPAKTSYKIGEGFNENGLSVVAQYSDGSSKEVTDYTVSGFDSSTAGTKTVTVSYTEDGVTKTCKFNVTVIAEKKLIAISVASMPAKTVYQIGEEFSASGLVVNAFYDDGTTSFVTDYTVSGFDSEIAGTKTVVVAYTDKGVTKSCTFEVTVEEPADEGNFFTNLINSIVNFFMSIIEFFTSLLG